ncbi:type II toxin-antitoxin system RelE/ParE family toxin [Anatilimnocola sp. NA78]|uniref:type II toxin-antitoxin system RelE/ParE family toxin n=1 Tax=Anatilimnocola sp. NA78 TaxID=3415683 RepID=UPI003CE518D9
MANVQLEYHRLAIIEVRKAKRWYQRRSLKTGVRFEEAVRQGLAEIADNPDHWPTNPDGTRFRRLTRFPYLIIYRQLDAQRVRIVAVVHGRRRHSFWSRRK